MFRSDVLPQLTDIQHTEPVPDEQILSVSATTTTMTPLLLTPRCFTPLEIKKIYNMPVNAQNEKKRPRIVVPSFGGGLFGKWNSTTKLLENGDCQKYWARLGITKQATVRVNPISGAKNAPSTKDGGTYENSLDVQILGCINPNIDIELVIAPNTAQGFLGVLDYCLASKPNFVSFSWGLPESVASNSFLQAANNKMKQLVEQGCNITAAAGDNGSHDGQAQPTMDFPASSPWVTSCGGTRLLCSSNNVYDSKTQETVWNTNSQSSATGGGRSKVFPLPSYQKDIPGITGAFRCGPDISATAAVDTGCYFLVNDELISSGGTSVVSPVTCGYFSLTNLNSFANPMIYKAPLTCFHDIVSGNNGAYSATQGFDMTTGFGSIDGIALMTAFQPTTIKISPATLSFSTKNHKPQQLSLVFDPPTTSTKTVSGTWTSSDPQIATCDQNGIVAPVSNGTCFITHSGVADSSSSSNQSVAVTVSGISILTTNITLTPQLPIGSQLVLSVEVFPANATNKSIGWTSLTPDIASVNANTGLITAIAKGTAVIRATTRDARKISKTFEIYVVA